MNQVIDGLQRKCSDDSTGVNLLALEDRSLSASTGSVENCRLDMVRHETWRSLPLLSWNLRRQTLQGEGSPPSQRRLSAITDLTENAAFLRASYTASLPCRPNSIVVGSVESSLNSRPIVQMGTSGPGHVES